MLKPLSDTVFIEAEEAAKTSTGGIVLPDNIEEGQFTIGKVVAVGPGRTERTVKTEMSIVVGDTVIVKKYGFKEITVEGKKLQVGKEEDILAIL